MKRALLVNMICTVQMSSWMSQNLIVAILLILGFALNPKNIEIRSAYASPPQATSFWSGPRWVVDMGIQSSSENLIKSHNMMNFLGLDFYSDLRFGGKLSGNFVAQFYLFDMRRLSFDPELSQQRAFNYSPCVIAPELILISQGLLNLKFGHIWPSYGLRNDVNTTQTLRQLIDFYNVGLNTPVDWGAELNGQTSGMSYHVSLTRGSGKWWSNEGDRYIVSGRFGLIEGSWLDDLLPLKLGLSGMSSRLNVDTGGLIERWRAGLDLQYEGPISALFEGSIGEDASLDRAGEKEQGRAVINLIAELGWRSPSNRWFVYIQQRYLSTEQEAGMPQLMSDNLEMSASLAGQQIPLDASMVPVAQSDLLTAQVMESSTLGVLYNPLRTLYLGAEVAWRGGSSTPLSRLQVRYRW